MVRFSGAAFAAFTIGLMSNTSSIDAFAIPTNKQAITSSIAKKLQHQQQLTNPSFTRCKLRSTANEMENPTKDEKKSFANDGLFSWMQPYLDLFGFVEGNKVYYGPGVAVDESQFPSKEEQQKLRQEAEENMMNIGMEERERRRQAGNIAYKIVFAYAILSSIFLDDGTISGNLARFAIAMPLFFATGYTKSADTGL